jgi:FAD/FMN-containing dehydrogenase/Fe-S oxidoreductase
MKKDFTFREIPYNYTSFSDKEIIHSFFPSKIWNILESLREQRITGRSAKLLFEVLGDIFIIERNPYLYEEYLANSKKRSHLWSQHHNKLQAILDHAADKEMIAPIIDHARKLCGEFFSGFAFDKKFRIKIAASLSTITAPRNIRFSPFHKVSHVTDATDWRVHYPFVIVYPDKVEEIPRIIKRARKLGLKIIPRGGGTGLTGGAVPTRKNTLIINTEKIRAIHGIHEIPGAEANRSIPVVTVEAGAVTDVVTDYCRKNNYIFATDPTSGWASTIGGNIAENSGGKKAVMWGTAIDNVLSFKMYDAFGHLVEIRRRDHPHRKILPEDKVIFDVYRFHNRKWEAGDTIVLGGTDIRKKGLGKDITNKALGGVPGLQKEGGDGIIVSADFVLYRPFSSIVTICLEFYGKDLSGASRAIVNIKQAFAAQDSCHLTALEHFDEKYIAAIGYRNKSERQQIPKAVLLIDIESNEHDMLKEAAARLIEEAGRHDAEGFVAESAEAREKFWKDRKNLGAIAKHTNAFKLNEDVVIPIESLPEFADYIEVLNNEKELQNYETLLTKAENYIRSFSEAEDDFLHNKIEHFSRALSEIRTKIDLLIREQRKWELLHQLKSEIKESFEHSFHGYHEAISGFNDLIEEVVSQKIVIATHMHAGDGNIHVNIPVNSNNYAMLQDAEHTVGEIFKKTVELGGVISGEHGIGLTKLKFLDPHIIDDYAHYKDKVDPDHIFNPDKLTDNFDFERIYTPSLNLLEVEAFILETTELKKLTEQVSACVRCGKCKPVCNTNHPSATMFFSPRNKILALSLIVEAILYESQVGNSAKSRQIRHLREISDHCTMCHRCYSPCPVKIDFGKVTLAIRELLKDTKTVRTAPLTAVALGYLDIRDYHLNKFVGTLLYKGMYRVQNLAYHLNRPVNRLTKALVPSLAAPVQSALPKAGGTTIRDLLKLNENDRCYAFYDSKRPVKKSVLYFPGCGSERMFPDIAIATMAVLFELNVRCVIPPEYLCCGYPFLANGKSQTARQKAYRNSVIFHRIASTIGYMDISNIIVSCGTCSEMLDGYQLSNIFPHARVTDIAEFVVAQPEFRPLKTDDSQLFYHEPCHSPLRQIRPENLMTALFGKAAVLPDNCCGEGGTMSLSRPDISNILRKRKTMNIKMAGCPLSEKKPILTSCPSCVQGLSRQAADKNYSGKHLSIYLAEQLMGADWKKAFIEKIKSSHGVESILL